MRCALELTANMCNRIIVPVFCLPVHRIFLFGRGQLRPFSIAEFDEAEQATVK